MNSSPVNIDTVDSHVGSERSSLGADAQLCRTLAGLVPDCDSEFTQQHADELLARIAWSRLAEPSDRVTGELLALFGAAPALELLISGASAKQIVERAWIERGVQLSAASIAAALKRWRPRLDRSATLADIDRAVNASVRTLVPGSPHWATRLDDLGAHAPILLWTRGDPNILAHSALAIVGARAATGYGAHITVEIADGMCAAGVVVVSGAAYGIDAAAHRTALAASAPTVAVLAGGVDRPYPSSHDSLIAKIAETGLVCSEMIPGAAPTRWRFLMRNRVIAALSSATLVTEAGLRSGSLNTAGHAAELGRPLGAVPGPVTSAASAGCHKLIRDYGASLVTRSSDALELMGIDQGASLLDTGVEAPEEGAAPRGADHDDRPPPLHRRLLDALPLRGGRTLSDAARTAGVGIDEARGGLTELELLGFVRRRETPGHPAEKWELLRRK